MNQNKTQELALPPISVDIGVGKYVEDFQVDHDALAQHMLSNGANAQDIASTIVTFIATPLDKQNPNVQGDYNRSNGNIRIGVSKGLQPIVSALSNVPSNGAEQLTLQFGENEFTGNKDEIASWALKTSSAGVSKEASDTLAHEVERRLDDLKDNLTDSKEHHKTQARKLGGKLLGLVGIAVVTNIATKMGVENQTLATGINIGAAAGTAYAGRKIIKNRSGKVYESDPAEQRARAAEDSVPDFVTVTLKK